jgi:hypothetical protein
MKVRSREHAGKTVSLPRPGVNSKGDAVSGVVRFDEDGNATVTKEQGEFLISQFPSVSEVKRSG